MAGDGVGRWLEETDEEADTGRNVLTDIPKAGQVTNEPPLGMYLSEKTTRNKISRTLNIKNQECSIESSK
jgi:hypothetical protein